MKKPSKKCVKVAQRGRASAGLVEIKTTLVANSDPGGGGASLLGPLGTVLAAILGPTNRKIEKRPSRVNWCKLFRSILELKTAPRSKTGAQTSPRKVCVSGPWCFKSQPKTMFTGTPDCGWKKRASSHPFLGLWLPGSSQGPQKHSDAAGRGGI